MVDACCSSCENERWLYTRIKQPGSPTVPPQTGAWKELATFSHKPDDAGSVPSYELYLEVALSFILQGNVSAHTRGTGLVQCKILACRPQRYVCMLILYTIYLLLGITAYTLKSLAAKQ